MNRKTQAVLILALIQILVITNAGCFEPDTKPGLGDYAHAYLSDSKYERLIVEIDYVEGYEPSSQATDTLKNRLNFYCDKPEGILILKDSMTTTKSSYSDEDIRNLEDKHRDYFKMENDIVAYILYLNGEYSEDSNVLGIAYGASSAVIFKERIDEINIPIWAINLVDNTDYEKSVLVHEFGHLLAMVNIGYESERNHEGQEHHCRYDDCVMYHSVETVSIINLITQEEPKPPSDFCSDCRHDLNKLKSGNTNTQYPS